MRYKLVHCNSDRLHADAACHDLQGPGGRARQRRQLLAAAADEAAESHGECCLLPGVHAPGVAASIALGCLGAVDVTMDVRWMA